MLSHLSPSIPRSDLWVGGGMRMMSREKVESRYGSTLQGGEQTEEQGKNLDKTPGTGLCIGARPSFFQLWHNCIGAQTMYYDQR